MRSKKIKQQRTILALTPEEWDEKINAALMSLPCSTETTIIRERKDGEFMAVVEYTITEYEPEDIAEEFELRGTTFHCCDCPQLKKSPDKRVRWHECMLGMKELTKESSIACEWYYEQVKKAEGLK